MNGLRYQTDGRVRYYEPDGPFYVDDIYYDPNRARVQWRTMLSLHDDECGVRECPAEADIVLTRSLSEEALDDWVRTGVPAW